METNNNYQKYFDSKEYITQIVGINNEQEQPVGSNEDKISKIIYLLTDPLNKDVKEETLILLKKQNAVDLMLRAIASAKAKNVKHILVAACWESEINFSKYLKFFIHLVLDTDYLVSLEAITAIENMEGPFNENDLKDAIKQLRKEQKNITSEKLALINDLIVVLENLQMK